MPPRHPPYNYRYKYCRCHGSKGRRSNDPCPLWRTPAPSGGSVHAIGRAREHFCRERGHGGGTFSKSFRSSSGTHPRDPHRRLRTGLCASVSTWHPKVHGPGAVTLTCNLSESAATWYPYGHLGPLSCPRTPEGATAPTDCPLGTLRGASTDCSGIAGAVDVMGQLGGPQEMVPTST